MKLSKKILFVLFVLFVILTATTLSVFATTPPKITVILDNNELQFDVPPQVINNRVLVPLRAIFEAIDVSIDWDDSTKTVVSKKDDIIATLTVGSSVMLVNGKEVFLDSPATIVDGRTMVPVRAISEAYNIKPSWQQSSKTVRLKTQEFIKWANENKFANFYEFTKKVGTTSDGITYTRVLTRDVLGDTIAFSCDGESINLVYVESFSGRSFSVALSIYSDSNLVDVQDHNSNKHFLGYYDQTTKQLTKFPYAIESTMDINTAAGYIEDALLSYDIDTALEITTGCNLEDFGIDYY